MSEQQLKQYADELHAPFLRKFDRRHVVALFPNDLWGSDLVDMSAFSDDNKGYKFLMTVIDVFSRKAWALPLKNKRAETILKAFKSLKVTPKNLWVDKGSEYYNNLLKKFNKDNSINMYSTYGEHKSAIVERFNRTLKEIMWKDFTRIRHRRWIDRLEGLLTAYNNRKHTTTGMKPAESYRTGKVAKTHKVRLIDKQPRFKVGDYVRIARVKTTFEKGYEFRWSHEVFKVIDVNAKAYPVMYQIEDYLGDKIEGKFYEKELQLTKLPHFGLVSKVLQSRTVRGRKEHLVRWEGHDPKFDSWISDRELKKLN